MGFTPYPDFMIVYNSQDLSLSQFLVLPSDYRKYYPTPLPHKAVLRKPEGNFWTVKWTLSQDETISFDDGWSKFIEDNEPIDGDFLLFSYDGSRSFMVSIFRNGSVVKPKAPVKIQEIPDDDEGETAGGDDDEEDETAGDDDDDDDDDDYDLDMDNNENMIISLSLGSSDEDNVDTRIGEVNKADGSSKRGGTSQKKRVESVGDLEMYLDDPTNPCFVPISTNRRMLVIAKQVIKDYDLQFGSTISYIDGFGELEGKIGDWKDRVVVHKWKEIYERNDAKPEDIIICEILREGGVVRSIKVHFVKN